MNKQDKIESPFPDYEWVRNGKDLRFPNGTVEEGYSLVRKTVRGEQSANKTSEPIKKASDK